MNNIKSLNGVTKEPDQISLWSNSGLPPSKIILPTRHGIDFITWTEVLYSKSDGNYTRIYTSSGKEILANMSISCFEKAVPENWFVRIHKQYIINIQHLIRYEKGDGGSVLLIQDIALPVSRERKKTFLNKLKGGSKCVLGNEN